MSGLGVPVTKQDLEGFFTGDRVGYVAEVNARDQLFRAHVREESPQWFALALGVEVPDGIDDGGRGEVYHTLLRTDPPELAVPRDVTPESAHVLCKRLEDSPLDERRERSYGFFFQAEDGIRDGTVTGVQTCALPIFDAGDADIRVEVVVEGVGEEDHPWAVGIHGAATAEPLLEGDRGEGRDLPAAIHP